MPVICIGPVCIPWTAVVPLMVWLLRPIFVRLPTPWQEFITTTAKSTRTWMQAKVWDRLGWQAKAKKKAPSSSTVEMAPIPAPGKPTASAAVPASVPAGLSPAATTLLGCRGKLITMNTEADWEAAMEASSKGGVVLFADYTAVVQKVPRQAQD